MSNYEYAEDAMERWYAKRGHRDHADPPSITVWMPSSMPMGRLQTHAHGCQEPDTLPDGPATAYLTVGGVQFGGYLDELELLFDAAREQLTNVRSRYEHMRAETTSEVSQ